MNYYKKYYSYMHFSLDTYSKMYFDSGKWIKVVEYGEKCLGEVHFIQSIQKGES
jgi:hypothetical protein